MGASGVSSDSYRGGVSSASGQSVISDASVKAVSLSNTTVSSAYSESGVSSASGVHSRKSDGCGARVERTSDLRPVTALLLGMV